MKNLTCIIPIYNEGTRPLTVIKKIRRIKGISEIICIDDGSKDDTSSKLINKKFPEVVLISIKNNSGKSGAVKRGLEKAKNDDILLIDGDLEEVDIDTISKGYHLYNEQKRETSLIFVYPPSSLIEKILLGNIIVSGTRIMSKRSLNQIFLQYKPNRYQLEAASNQHIIDNDINLILMELWLIAPHKIRKYGFFQGLFSDILKNINVLSFGIVAWIKHFLFFKGRKTIKQ